MDTQTLKTIPNLLNGKSNNEHRRQHRETIKQSVLSIPKF